MGYSRRSRRSKLSKYVRKFIKYEKYKINNAPNNNYICEFTLVVYFIEERE
jgi:hypothetical protein